MSSSATYFSSGSAGNSSAGVQFAYWNSQNYQPFYPHYYQSCGGCPQQQPMNQTQDTQGNSVAFTDINAKENPALCNFDRRKINTNSLVENVNEQQLTRKMTHSPKLQQKFDECLTSRYNTFQTVGFYQNNYSINHHRKCQSTEETLKSDMNCGSSLETQNDEIFPQISSGKKLNSPILEMVLNRPEDHKTNSSPSIENQKRYQGFYDSTFAEKCENSEKVKDIRQQYGMEEESTSRMSDSEGGTASDKTFDNIPQSESQIGYPGDELQHTKTPMNCLQPSLTYDDQEGAKQKLSHFNLYPWMKSFSGKALQLSFK